MRKVGVDDFFAAGGDGATLAAALVPFETWRASVKGEEGGKRALGLTKELADAITQDMCFAQDAGGFLYYFVGGVYRPKAEEYVRRRVKGLLEADERTKEWTSGAANEVVEYIRVDAPQLWPEPPLDIVNVQNGLLDVVTRTLAPHAPTHLSVVQIPVAYDPEATCPGWEKFVDDVFPADARDLAWEIPGYLMVPDTRIQQSILLLGDGGNGKSTYLKAVSAFLGRANVSALSLHKIESDRFAASDLVGKLANICADLPSEHLAGTAIFKQLTGGDVLGAEYKYKPVFKFQPFVRLLFSANRPPHSGDTSEAFFDRWVVVPFDRTFRGTKSETPRLVLDARLADPSELSGVLNHALGALASVRERHGFTQSETLREAAAEFRRETDPVAVWLERATLQEPDAWVLKSALSEAYAASARKEGATPLSVNSFGRALHRLRPGIDEKQRTVAGKLQWVWLGIGLRAPDTVGDSRHSRDSRESISVTSASDEKRKSGEAEGDGVSEITNMETRESREWSEGQAPGDGADGEEEVCWDEGEL